LQEGEEIWMRKLTLAQQWVHKARKGTGGGSPHTLPEEYKWHTVIFDKEKATRFPPQREEELGIKLLPRASKEIDCKVYPLSQAEQEQLHTFLEEEETKGYIYKGSSPYMATVFLIGKKDSDERRVIIDYWKLNEWVIHDNSPLPNIQMQLEKLNGKCIFTKFDIHWGYKNHWINAEDQPKAAFKPMFGTYIPWVVYFGLKNAPPFFQWMMAHEFQPLMQNMNPTYLIIWMTG